MELSSFQRLGNLISKPKKVGAPKAPKGHKALGFARLVRQPRDGPLRPPDAKQTFGIHGCCPYQD